MRNSEQLHVTIPWVSAFRVLRGVDRDPTDEERMIYNLAVQRGVGFDEAVELFMDIMNRSIPRDPWVTFEYVPEDGTIQEAMNVREVGEV